MPLDSKTKEIEAKVNWQIAALNLRNKQIHIYSAASVKRSLDGSRCGGIFDDKFVII